MKKLVTATLIPALAAIAVIGSGFSVFYFGNSEKANTSLDPTVENVVTSGTLSTPETLKLHLDQTLATRKAIAGDGVFTGEAKGIYLASEKENEQLTIKYTRPASTASVNNTDYVEGVAKINLYTFVTIPDAYVPYVTVVPGTNVTSNGGLQKGAYNASTGKVEGENGKTLWLSWTLTDEQIKAGDIERNLPGYNATDPLFTFAYATIGENDVTSAYTTADRKSVTTNEPVNADEYAQMKNAITAEGAGNIVVTTTLTFMAATK